MARRDQKKRQKSKKAAKQKRKEELRNRRRQIPTYEIVYNVPIKAFNFRDGQVYILADRVSAITQKKVTPEIARLALEAEVSNAILNSGIDYYDSGFDEKTISATNMDEPKYNKKIVGDYKYTVTQINNRKLKVRDNKCPVIASFRNLGSPFENQCALDCLLQFLQGTEKNKKLTRDKLIYQLKELGIENDDGYDLDDIYKYLESRNISYHIVTGEHTLAKKTFETEKTKCHGKTFFVNINNDHMYLIDNPEIQDDIRYDRHTGVQPDWKTAEVVHLGSGSVSEIYNQIKNDGRVYIIEKLINDKGQINKKIIPLATYIFRQERVQVENLTELSFTYYNSYVYYNKDASDVVETIKTLNIDGGERIFQNQTMGGIAMELFEAYGIPSGSMNTHCASYFKGICIPKFERDEATCKTFEVDMEKTKAWDINSAYPSALLSLPSIYVCDCKCQFEPVEIHSIESLKEGYYRLNLTTFNKCTEEEQLSTLKLDNHFKFHHTLRSTHIKRLLAMKVIKLSDIAEFMQPAYIIPTGVIRSYYDNLLKFGFTKKQQKKMLLALIGKFGAWSGERLSLTLTCSKELAYFLRVDEKINYIDELDDDLFMMVNKKKYDKVTHYRNIFHDVVMENVFALYNLYKKAMNENSILVAFNIDSVTVYNGNDVPCDTKLGGVKQEKLKLNGRGKTTFFDTHDQRIKPKEFTRKNLDDLDDESFCLIGSPGTGKSYCLANEILPFIDEKIYLMSFSNKACAELNSKLPDDVNVKCKTICSVLHAIEAYSIKLYDCTIIIDEAFAMSYCDLETIYTLWRRFQFRCILVGDADQLMGVNEQDGIVYDRLQMVKEMCPYLVELTEQQRFDTDLGNVLRDIKTDKPVTYKFPLIKDRVFKRNICMLNKTRIAINEKAMNHFANDDCLVIPYKRKVSDRSSQPVKLIVGSPVICVDKKSGCYNMQQFEVEKWDDINITLRDGDECKEFPIAEFHNWFRVAHALTIHMMQGTTIDEDIGIYDCSRFSKRMAYTALSRNKKCSQIYLYEPLPDVYANEKPWTPMRVFDKQQPEYVYSLRHEGKVFYIGQTNDINRRFAEHNECYNNRDEIDNKYKQIEEKGLYPFAINIERTCYTDVNKWEKKIIERWERATELLNTQLLPKKKPKQVKVAGDVERKKITVGHIESKKNKNGDIIAYAVVWRVAGKKQTKTFNIKKLAPLDAKAEAEKFRDSLSL